MKKALLTIAVVIAAITSQAQNFRIGVSGGVNSTWLMNKNVFDADDALDIAATFGGRFGIDAIYSFSEKAGISVGFNFLSANNQKYEGEITTTSDYELTEKLNYFDIPVLFRITSSGGTYFEIGPQFGFLTKAKQDYDSDFIKYEDLDVKDQFNTTNVALVFGFGVDIDVTEKIFITTGLRLGYGFSDVTKEYDTKAELNAETGGQFTGGGSTYWAHIDDDNDFNYEKTSRVFGGLNVGVSYKFGGSK